MEKTYQDLTFRPLTSDNIAQLTTIMKNAFDADSQLHLGKNGGPEGYDNGEFLRRWGLHKNATSYTIWQKDVMVGGLILWINPSTRINNLGTIFIDSSLQQQGLGTKVWAYVEQEYPDTLKWCTDTPLFSHRNHHFYINKLGFHAVKIDRPLDNIYGCFILEKVI